MFWFKGNQMMRPMLFKDFDDCNGDDINTRNAFVAGIMSNKMGADLVVLLTDAAFRHITDGKIPSSPEEQPLSYPRSMRTECIVIIGIKVPSGESDVMMVPYKGGEGEPVEFIPNELPKEAKFETRFSDLVVQGWKKASMFPSIEAMN
jgi:hypothetical protein